MFDNRKDLLMKKKIIIVLSILLIGVAGFFGYKKYAQYVEDKKPLIVITEDDVSIDITKKINPNDYLTNIKEDVELSYVLDEENSILTITAKQGEKEEVYQKEVTIVYPTIEVQDDIVIDYNEIEEVNINDYINVPEDATVDYVLDEENGHLTITITDGEYSKTIEQDVEVIPEEKWPKHFVGGDNLPQFPDSSPELYLYKDGTAKLNTCRPSYPIWRSLYFWKDENGVYHIKDLETGKEMTNVVFDGKRLTFTQFPPNPNNISYWYDLVEE